MTNFSDMLSKAKAMQEKMKEAQDQIKKIEVEGEAGGNIVKVIFLFVLYSMISWLFDLVKCNIPVFSTEKTSEKLDSRSCNWLLRY